MPGMLNCDRECWLQLLRRTHREAALLGRVFSWASPWSSATLHRFSWTTTWQPRATYPRSWRRQLLREDGDFKIHEFTFQRRWRTVCAAGLSTDKDMENYWVWFWLMAWWGAREVLGLVGEQGSEQKCSQPLWGCNPVNKNLFSPTVIVGSCLEAPLARALVCGVTELLQLSFGVTLADPFLIFYF